MILDRIRDNLSEAIRVYKNDNENKYGVYTRGLFGEEDIKESSATLLIDKLEEAQEELSKIQADKPAPFNFDHFSFIEEEVSSFAQDYKDKVNSIELEKQKRIQKINEEREARADKVRAEIQALKAEEEARTGAIRDRYLKLCEYKERLSDLVKMYDLAVDTEGLNTKSCSWDAVTSVLEEGEVLASYIFKGDSAVSKALSYVYYPLTKDNVSPALTITWSISILLTCVLIGDLAFPAISTLFIYNMFMEFKKTKERQEAVVALSELINGIDLPENEEIGKKEKELEAILAEDLSGKYSVIESKVNAYLETLDVPDKERDRLRAEVSSLDELVEKESSAVKEEIAGLYKASIEAVAKSVECISNELTERAEALKQFGTEFSEEEILGKSMKIGTVYYGDKSIDFETCTLPNRNTLFVYRDEDEKADRVEQMKLYVMNLLSNVAPGNCEAQLLDVLELGREYSSFLKKDVIGMSSPMPSKTIDALKEELTDRIKTVGSLSYAEYLDDCIKSERVIPKYKLLIVNSLESSVITNKALTSLLPYSVEYGVIIYAMIDLSKADEEKSIMAEYDKVKESCHIVESPIVFSNDRVEPIKITPAVVERFCDNFSSIKESRKPKMILYKPDVWDRFYTPDKMFTGDSTRGIKIRVGFVEGDKNRFEYINLGDAPVHWISVGDTGAGKSAFIAQLILSLILEYSPEQLEIVYIDLKYTEAGFYQGDYTLPSASIVAATSDPDYLLSVYRYIYDRMLERQRKFRDAQVKDITTWNSLCDANGDKKSRMSRILLLADEIQQLQSDAIPDKVRNDINGKVLAIAKLGRATGVHVAYTSQSMKGVMNQDVKNQFDFRLALRCKEDLSVETIGTKNSAHLPGKIGFCRTNDTGATNLEAEKMWKIPYADDDTRRAVIKAVKDKCNELGIAYNKEKIFSEQETIPSTVLGDYLNNYPEKFCVEERFILGERTTYTTSKGPVNFSLAKSSGNNLVVVSSSKANYMRILDTLLLQIEKRGASYIIGTADENDLTLTNLKTRVDERTREFFLDVGNIETVVGTVQAIYQSKKEAENKDEFYIILMSYENLPAFFDSREFANVVLPVMKEGPMIGIHFIFMFNRWVSAVRPLLRDSLHLIASDMPKDEAMMFIDNTKPALFKEEDGLKLGLYKNGDYYQTFKVYQFPITGTIKSREVFID